MWFLNLRKLLGSRPPPRFAVRPWGWFGPSTGPRSGVPSRPHSRTMIVWRAGWSVNPKTTRSG